MVSISSHRRRPYQKRIGRPVMQPWRGHLAPTLNLERRMARDCLLCGMPIAWCIDRSRRSGRLAHIRVQETIAPPVCEIEVPPFVRVHTESFVLERRSEHVAPPTLL